MNFGRFLFAMDGPFAMAGFCKICTELSSDVELLINQLEPENQQIDESFQIDNTIAVFLNISPRTKFI
jgi:hypothetical protein